MSDASVILRLEVRGYALKRLNELLRGAHLRRRAAARRRELANIALLLRTQNQLPTEPIAVPVAAYFVQRYKHQGGVPDVDSRWKLVGDALEVAGVLTNDRNVRPLTLDRQPVTSTRDLGFLVELRPSPELLPTL